MGIIKQRVGAFVSKNLISRGCINQGGMRSFHGILLSEILDYRFAQNYSFTNFGVCPLANNDLCSLQENLNSFCSSILMWNKESRNGSGLNGFWDSFAHTIWRTVLMMHALLFGLISLYSIQVVFHYWNFLVGNNDEFRARRRIAPHEHAHFFSSKVLKTLKVESGFMIFPCAINRTHVHCMISKTLKC